MRYPIKLIATDLDGTLLNSDHIVTPRTERALKAAIAQGVQVIFATGKTMHSRQKLVEQLRLATPGVYSQGLVLLNADGSTRYRRDLDREAARPVIAFLEARGYNLVAVAEGGTRLLAERLSSLTDFMIAHHEPFPELVGPVSGAVEDTPLTKLLIEIPPAELPAVRDELARLGGDTIELVQSMPQLLEVLPPGASKGDGLRRLLDDLGIAPAEVIAFGDAENDLEMLQMVGIGVAMGNATDSVKAVADYVTASNDEDGVGLAVERFVLNGNH
ncbi:MAG: HAD family phosphatase [Anaerolineae bacterium]|nr:HAD family phosphatase [Anaerolineae bacterium]